MSELRSRLRQVYAEAGRWRLFRVIVVYLLVGLATLEGICNLRSALSFPGWTDTLVAVVLLVGFRTLQELEKGIELFRQALAIDDRYALA